MTLDEALFHMWPSPIYEDGGKLLPRDHYTDPYGDTFIIDYRDHSLVLRDQPDQYVTVSITRGADQETISKKSVCSHDGLNAVIEQLFQQHPEITPIPDHDPNTSDRHDLRAMLAYFTPDGFDDPWTDITAYIIEIWPKIDPEPYIRLRVNDDKVGIHYNGSLFIITILSDGEFETFEVRDPTYVGLKVMQNTDLEQLIGVA